MSYSRHDPVLHPTGIADLRPTQMTVGLLEVERKLGDWRAKNLAKKSQTLLTHMIPVVLGPDGARYITDHHHLARALWDDGQKDVFVTVIGDLRKADSTNFWTLMDYHGWTHPYDSKGSRCDYRQLPKTVAGLADDPYRSVAGALRQAGGFAKDSTPFSEFVWADFFRSRLKVKDIKRDYRGAVAHALALAKSAEADYLPGWSGPHDMSGVAAPAKKPRAKKI